jgi:predicted glycogen debranching enzyme
LFEKIIPRSLTYYLSFSLGENTSDPSQAEDLYEESVSRKQKLIDSVDLPDQAVPLLLSSDRFVVQKGLLKTIIAGYHWFSDWGRDTLIALPGITLVSGRFEDARSILNGFNQFCRNGLIPNTFDDLTGEASYNTVDASLWFIDRVFQYVKYTNDSDFLIAMFPTIQSIIRSYMEGTDHGIGMDDDYLIRSDPGLTWMDVKLGDFYPTPRSQKAVEIQALWYNALCIASICARYLGVSDEYKDIAKNVKQSFLSVYDKQYDVIGTRDLSCRPNKLFLVSLDFSMIPSSMQKDIVDDVSRNLVTVFGLRTLSPHDKGYIGSYLGDHQRDLAYHNGTVWPWLLGSFLTSCVKINKRKKKSRQFAFDEYIAPMLHVFGQKWDGSISEIFDADPPFAPRGCMNQAWSVAEILRAWVEDILDRRPPYERNFHLDKIQV